MAFPEGQEDPDAGLPGLAKPAHHRLTKRKSTRKTLVAAFDGTGEWKASWQRQVLVDLLQALLSALIPSVS